MLTALAITAIALGTVILIAVGLTVWVLMHQLGPSEYPHSSEE